MFRRSSVPTSVRVFTLVLAALFFNSSTLDALALERCPHHGAAALATASHTATAPAHDSAPASMPASAHNVHDGHDGHGGGHLADAAETNSDDAAPDHGLCTCMGDCSGTTAVAPPADPAVHTSAVTILEQITARPRALARTSRHLELLPYSNAPPAL